MKRLIKKQDMKGILTVELAYLMPILFSIFVLVIHTTFYYHDKNILLGAASETAVVWAQIKRAPGEDISVELESIYQERIEGKLILFSGVSASVNETEEQVEVTANAQSGIFSVEVCGRAAVVKAEEQIRKKRILENWTEQEE